MFKFFVATFMLLGSSAFGEGLKIEQAYSMTPTLEKAQNTSCLKALARQIAVQFEGLHGVQLQSPAVVYEVADTFTQFVFAGSVFQSKYGDVRGTLICIFKSDQTRVSEISATFEGRGLAGFKKHILAESIKDPAKRRVLSYSCQTPD